jgi:putative oxidoreductase
MKQLLSGRPWPYETLLVAMRVLTGIFLVVHGWEVLQPDRMAEYVKWEAFAGKSYLPYIGKGAELVAGVLLVLGLFTRIASLFTIGTFLYITFFIGNGKFWMEDQHPFLFAMFGLLFLFTGPGKWCLDKVV